MAPEIHHEAIDAHFLPRARDTVVAIALDGQGVLYDEVGQGLHVLNPAATAVWACCDGTQPVRAIAEELAREFAAPLEDVMTDTLAAVRDFGARGLLDGVENAYPQVADPATTLERSVPRYLETPPHG